MTSASNNYLIWGGDISGSLETQIELIPNLPVAMGDYDGHEVNVRMYPNGSPWFVSISRDERKGTITGLLTGSLDAKTWTAGVGYESIRARSNMIDWSASIYHQKSTVTVAATIPGLTSINQSISETATRGQFDLTADLMDFLSLGLSGSARLDDSTRDVSKTAFISVPIGSQTVVALGHRRFDATSTGFARTSSEETVMTLGYQF